MVRVAAPLTRTFHALLALPRKVLSAVGALVLALAVMPALTLLSAGAAHAATTVTPVPINNSCNGIVPTPGSENTLKKLVGGDLEPGGTATFEISYPLDPTDVGQTFVVQDCPVLGGDVGAAQAYEFLTVPNNQVFDVEFTLNIPADTPIGTTYCNYAKTTGGPSSSPASNRKAGPACFTVGGNLRIEKHATGDATDLLAGAAFSVTCPTAAPTTPPSASPVEITGLVDSSDAAVTAGYNTTDGAWEASGTANPGFIGIAGPSGTVCTVTETAAPPGYVLPSTTSHDYTIPVGTSQQVVAWYNAPAVIQLHLAKSADPVSGSTVAPSSQIDYTLAYYNDGNVDATNATITDTLPDHTTFVSASNGGTYDAASRTITWTGIDVGAGTSAVSPAGSVTFRVTVDADTPNGTELDNTGHIQLGESEPIDSNTTQHFVRFPVIGSVKSSDPASGTVDSPTPVVPGQTISYTVAVSNSGQANATGVSVTDAIPTGTTYVDGSADNGGTLSGGSLSWSVDVAADSTVNLHFQVTVNGSDGNGTLIDNTAAVNQTPTNTTHHEVEFAVLTLAKSSNPASGSVVQLGDRIDYTVTLANSGLAASAPTTVSDTLPDHVTVVAGSPSPAFTSVNGNVVSWTVTVPAKSTATLTYSVTVNQDAPQGATLTNVALVNGQCVGNADATACTTDHHVPTGALTLVKHVDKATASYGDTLTYTFEASTTGALDQGAVQVSDVLPKGTAYVTDSAGCSDAGTCTVAVNSSTKTVTWQLGDMAAGATRHLVFKVTITKPSFNSTTGLPATTIVNSGVVASAETPSTPSNQVVTKVVAVLGVKVVRAPTLAFTGLPAQRLLILGLLVLGMGVVLMVVRRREQ